MTIENHWRKTDDGVAYLPAQDSLWRHAPTPFAAHYEVMGIPLAVTSNAPLLLEMAQTVFGDWGAPGEIHAPQAKQLRLFLHEVPEPPRSEHEPSLTMRMQGESFLLQRGGSLLLADGAAGVATSFVTPALLKETLLAQACFVECPGIYLVSCERPATLHAAAIVHEGQCVLLTGRSGAGKSTLSYACLRAGFGLLAEDTVFTVPQSGPLTAWGNPWRLHLLPDAVRLFPELAHAPTVRQMNGETKFRLEVAALHPGAAVPQASIAAVCSLERTARPNTEIVPADTAHLRDTLTDFKGDPPLDRAAMSSAVDRLLTGRTGHLKIGTSLDGAVATLRQWIEGG